jgi:hypothetical protein
MHEHPYRYRSAASIPGLAEKFRDTVGKYI